FLRENGNGSGDWTPSAVARWAADINALKVMDLKMASMVANGEVPYYEASLLKVLSTEFQTRFYNEALQALGQPGLIKRGSAGELPGQREGPGLRCSRRPLSSRKWAMRACRRP